ncbi:MAG: hypothetical protein K2X25_15575 [Caulobacteraceae bacterium]|nr:hypothetical protein [Caulobacteraceae bacterium]
MLVRIKLVGQDDAVILTELVIRFRETYPATDPVSVELDLHPDRYISSESLADIHAKLDPHLVLAKLTTPAGTAVYIDAEKVIGVVPAGLIHHPTAKAVIRFTEGGDQQVQETVKDVADALRVAA